MKWPGGYSSSLAAKMCKHEVAREASSLATRARYLRAIIKLHSSRSLFRFASLQNLKLAKEERERKKERISQKTEETWRGVSNLALKWAECSEVNGPPDLRRRNSAGSFEYFSPLFFVLYSRFGFFHKRLHGRQTGRTAFRKA